MWCNIQNTHHEAHKEFQHSAPVLYSDIDQILNPAFTTIGWFETCAYLYRNRIYPVYIFITLVFVVTIL